MELRDIIREAIEAFERDKDVQIRIDVFGSEYSTGAAARDDLVDRIAGVVGQYEATPQQNRV